MDEKIEILENDLVSLCPVCLQRIKGRKLKEKGKVYLEKACAEHGPFKCLIEDDADYYGRRHEYDKPGTGSKTQTAPQRGCPYDCGLCREHKQHTCIGLIEITSACNLNCPTCYADAQQGSFLEIGKIEEMVDFLIEAEGGRAEIIQISGGEPTLHPEIISIISMIRAKNVNYVMLNTNGIRLAEDEAFVKELAAFDGRFEVYLQFDGLETEVYEKIRGRDLLQVKLDAIGKLAANCIPITLVVTVDRGVNEDQVGRIFEFGVNRPMIRGINFQPVAYFGRHGQADPADRCTLTGILKGLEKQTNRIIKMSDFIPLPCDVERVAISYLYREKSGFTPLARRIDAKKYLPAIKNTFNFNTNELLDEAIKNTSIAGCSCFDFLKALRPLIPKKFDGQDGAGKKDFINNNIFRISVTSFVDAFNFDLRSAQKECVHIITPDLRRIPFSMYNLLYRSKHENL